MPKYWGIVHVYIAKAIVVIYTKCTLKMENNKMYIDDFLEYLEKDKKNADNTILAYKRDITAFKRFVSKRDVIGLENVTNSHVVAYLLQLKNLGKSKSTVNRKLASIRAFYNFLIRTGVDLENPTNDIKSPKIDRKEIEYLTIEEIDKLLSMPDNTVKGIRDRALLEVLYATGIRVTEIIEIKLKDVNIRMGFVTCNGEHGRARIVPMGGLAKKALENYILNSRDFLMKDKNCNDPELPLFVNYMGESITRQGLWKILKEYGRLAGLEDRITPHILRNSFAVHMIQNGADLKSLQELLGHEDIAATQIYLSVTKNRIKDVYDKTHPRA